MKSIFKLLLAAAGTAAAIFALAPMSPTLAQRPAPAVSALDDPASVDWDARFEGARAAKDVNAFIQILELAPLPEWVRVIDKSVEELVKLSDTPNIETPGGKPGATGSFISITVKPDSSAETPGALRVSLDSPVPQGRLVYAHFAKEFPAETASMALVLRPPVHGVAAELSDMTLVKSGGREFVIASVLFLAGPAAPIGDVSMTGSLIAKSRAGGILAEAQVEVEFDVIAEPPSADSVSSWFKSALAHRWGAALARTGEVKTGWIDMIFGGADPETDRKNRIPNARRHELVAFFYGEMLRQAASLLYGDAEESPEVEREEPEVQAKTRNAALAAEDSLIRLESLELRRAQYIASRAGDSLPTAIEGGYWWSPSRTGGKFESDTQIDPKTIPPRYRN